MKIGLSVSDAVHICVVELITLAKFLLYGWVQSVKPKFHYADFHWSFPARKVADTYHESRGLKRWQIMKSWCFSESCRHRPSRHVAMFATKSVTSSRQTHLCRSNGI